jgi:hypothetical protein
MNVANRPTPLVDPPKDRAASSKALDSRLDHRHPATRGASAHLRSYPANLRL